MNKHASPLAGILATITGGSVSLTEALTNGSLFLTCAGGVLALAGGIFTYRAARMKYRASKVELAIRELEYARALAQTK